MTTNDDVQAEIRHISALLYRKLNSGIDEVTHGAVTERKTRRAVDRIEAAMGHLNDLLRSIAKLDPAAAAIEPEDAA